MDDTTTASDGEYSGPTEVIDIAPDGDVILDVTFDTSKKTLLAAKKAAAAVKPVRPRAGQTKEQQNAQPSPPPPPPPVPKPRVRKGFRVQISVLKAHSKYFSNLLSDSRFAEAKSITAAFERLSLLKTKPSDADAKDLPLIKIHEDDEATHYAGQDRVFEDLLRLLHTKKLSSPGAGGPVTLHYLATFAVLADRFDCTAFVSAHMKVGEAMGRKWPLTQPRRTMTTTTAGGGDDGAAALSFASEETLRQKILVTWLLEEPLKFQAATRELILYGSRRWSRFALEDDEESSSSQADSDDDQKYKAAWWHLPDGLESELQHRRDCILRTVASVPSFFLRLYMPASRSSTTNLQCRRGYDSSPSCDSYQLGEAVRFLVNKQLFFLVNFSGDQGLDEAMARTNGYATATDVNHVISVLRQLPSYQIDKNHLNCGLRLRVLPILDFIQSSLSSGAVAVSRTGWKRDPEGSSWVVSTEGEEEQVLNHHRGARWDSGGGGGGRKSARVFVYDHSMAGDQRLRFEGSLEAGSKVRALFTADQWVWASGES